MASKKGNCNTEKYYFLVWCGVGSTQKTMNDYLLNPDVCPSSLGENDEPITEGETAHKWDEETGICNECGGTREYHMSDIQLVHEGEDYITITYKNSEGKQEEAEITGRIAIEAIKTLGRALLKDSFIKKD